MIRIFPRMLPLLLLGFLLFATPALADREDINDGQVKDSVYFTMDDGMMSEAEMKMEAQYVYGQCTVNAYESNLFDCQCVSGAFLILREKHGPMTPQSDILDEITNSPSAKCANPVAMAGTAYQDCIQWRHTYDELATDNEPFCSCVGNKVARDFSKTPRLSTNFVAGLQVTAMAWCRDPANRKKKTDPAAETGSKIPPKGSTSSTAPKTSN